MIPILIVLTLLIAVGFSSTFSAKSLKRVGDFLWIAEGEVEVRFKGFLFRADEVYYLEITGDLFAFGNVEVWKEDGSFEVFGSYAYVNFNENRGVFLDAHGRFREFYFGAKRIERISEKVFKVEEGEVTTCPPSDKELKVCFRKAKITEGYVTTYRNRLKLFDVPIFYSPISVFPVGNRRSGFLPPMIGSNSYNNLIFIQPFFWAISRDKDATFTLDFRDKQAKGVSVEYRQALSYEDRIFSRISFYKEPVPAGEWWKGRPFSTFRENRYRAELSLRLGNFKAGLDLISDPYFLEDVYFSQNLRTMPYTLSYLSYSKATKRTYLYLTLRSFYDTTSPNNDRSLSMLPEGLIYVKPFTSGPFQVSLTSSFTNFLSKEETSVRRFSFIPEIFYHSTPFGFNNLFSLKLISNFYASQEQDYDNFVGTFKLEDRVPIFNRFRFGSLDLDTVIEGVYSYSPRNFNIPQLDPTDAVNRENRFSLRLNQTLSTSYRTLATLFLEGSYNLLASYRFPTDSQIVKKKLLPVRGILSVFPHEKVIFTQDTLFDPNLSVFVRNSSSISVELEKLTFSGSYLVSRNSKNDRLEDQYNLSAEINVKGFITGGSYTFDNITDKELFSSLFLGYAGSCWVFKVSFRNTYYGQEKGYLKEIFLIFNIFNLQDFKLPLRRR